MQPMDGMKTQLTRRYEALLAEGPDRLCLIDGDREYTRREFASLIEECKGDLSGTETGRIGIVLEHGARQVASIFAALELGLTYVPAEPSTPHERLRFMMQEAGVDLLLSDKTLSFEDLKCVHPGEQGSGERLSKAFANPGYILFTSGSSGHPKGVEVGESAILTYIDAFQAEFLLTERDRMLQHSVVSFDIFVEEVFASILNGASLVIPPLRIRDDLTSLFRYMEEKKVSVVSAFPYLARAFDSSQVLPSSLRLFISGGDVLRASYVERLRKLITVYNTYGPSETTVCVTYFNASKGEALPDGTFPIGKPISGSQIQIVDGDLKERERGSTGEILIIGPGVADGYVGSSSRENTRFLTLPDGRRGYLSGDLGSLLEDGNIAFHGRKDNQVMIYGKRVEPGEVTSVLEGLPGVKEAVVVSAKDDEGLDYLVAHLVSETPQHIIRRSLRQKLPSYMIPEAFCYYPFLPRNPRGKIDVPSLKELPRLIIREARDEEMDTVIALRMKTIQAVFCPYYQLGEVDLRALEQANRSYLVEARKKGMAEYYLAFVHDELIGGAAICYQEELPSPDRPHGFAAYLMSLYIEPSFRKNGYGGIVIDFLVERSKERGAEKIYLESSRMGRRLYGEMGFASHDWYLFYEDED